MDLVDIDKVLDDLELNENREPSSTTEVVEKQNVDFHEPSTTVVADSEQVVSAQSNSKNINSSEERNKKFVAVSHVFSSLDDYRRDVETLEEEIKRLETSEGNENKESTTSNQNQIKSTLNNENETKIQSPAEEDDPTEDFQDEGDCITSASSITTSSPSSFSSGPSPGSSTESCSFISGPECVKLGKQNHKKQGDEEQIKEGRVEKVLKPEDSKNDPSAEVGLSSISSCLYNENTSSSIPGLSQDIKTDALSSISNYQEEQEEVVNQPVPSQLNHHSAMPRIEGVGLAQSTTPKVVGFGSTMDEISDTELDSILQEIDSDSQVFSAQAVNNIEIDRPLSEPMGTVSVAALAVSEDIVTDPISASIEEVTCDLDAPTPSKRMEEDDNLQNADSFSQASTIEFAELRLQSDFGTDALADDRSTSSNSGMKADAHSDFLNSTSSVSAGEKTGKESRNEPAQKNSLATPNSISEVGPSAAPKTAVVSPKQILQRPNSLDLPTQTPVEVNINATAGQTPPALRLDDAILSSSSSEDIPQPPASGEIQEVWSQQPQSQSSTNFETDTGIEDNSKLGKVPPFWIPDSEANACMQCKQKFSLIKRRHHCRACGQVLCSACCSQKAKLEFLGDSEVRVCVQCHLILTERAATDGTTATSQQASNNSIPGRSPNPNNPMEYCSVIPPHQQVSQGSQSPISVMVPVGVLKREGSSKNGRKDKNVIFSDGIRPGCDLTELDNAWDDKTPGGSGSSGYRKISKRDQTPPAPSSQRLNRVTKQLPICNDTDSYIPKESNALPPIYVTNKGEHTYKEVKNDAQLIEQLQSESLKFAVQRNFYIFVKIVKLKCCINKTIINFTTLGMHHVGQDEIVILLELDNSGMLPKDIFVHLNDIYRDADKGFPVTELGFSLPKMQNFLGSKENGGFLYIRPTFQCLQEIHLPESPFLIGILIHRWEVPWAKNFSLRLMLRLGAQYRYYPSPHISVRGRDAVYGEIAQTIINFLADFRNYTYTIATIKGMYIHMEDRRTSISIPKNRYDQVLKAVNNSSDHILALGGNFSRKADGHLVCIQNMDLDCPETRTYSTQAINIQGQPRKITGASFIVLNGALKTASGLSGKCSIVEDGLMVQILPSKMTAVRNALKNMKDVEIICGPVDADENQTEIVSMKWTGNDLEFNIGVKSPIDSKRMDGIPSIRVHSGLNFSNANHTIRWTEVFIIQSDEESAHGKDPIDASKLSEQIAKSTSRALVSFLDLLAASGCVKIGLRATLHQENVCYEAGSQNQKLAPLYMNALDNELIPTLHKQTTSLEIDTPIILELIFHILDK